jgi:hypothetical protein
MKKNLSSTNQKPLRFKKTAIAQLQLTNREMRFVQGGALVQTDPPTGSDVINLTGNPCTTIPIPTICSHGLATR